MASEQRRTREIPVDITDLGDAFEVSADLPGYDKQDIDVRLQSDRLQIIARRPESQEPGVHRRRERQRGRRSRIIELPESVYKGGTSARYENGVLWMRLKKRR